MYTETKWNDDLLARGPCSDDSDDLTQDQIDAQEAGEAEDYEQQKWLEETEEW